MVQQPGGGPSPVGIICIRLTWHEVCNWGSFSLDISAVGDRNLQPNTRRRPLVHVAANVERPRVCSPWPVALLRVPRWRFVLCTRKQ